MPQTFCTEMLKFLPAKPEAHPGCTVIVYITFLSIGYHNNNQKALYILAHPPKKTMVSDITATAFGFSASAAKMLDSKIPTA